MNTIGKHLVAFFFLFVVLSPGDVRAEEKKGMPSMQQAFPGMEMGQLEGDLFALEDSGKKKFLPNHEVMIKVFQQDQELLALHKTTDEKGHFVFKNIFKDPSFIYALGFFHDNQLFVMDGLKLDKAQDTLKVDFRVGAGSPYLVPEEVVNQGKGQVKKMPSSDSGQVSKKVSGLWKEPHQKVALILSLAVVGVFLYIVQRLINHKKISKIANPAVGALDPGVESFSGSSSEDKDLFLISWLHEKYSKGELPETVYRAQEAKILERLKHKD